jgi:hypothetical protein
MKKQSKLIEIYAKVNDNYSITNCHNGYLVEVSGQDKNEDWLTVKYLATTIEELKDIVQDLAWMPKT